MTTLTLEILIVLVLFLANGVFAMSEMAVVSARRSRLKQLSGAGDAGAAAALRLAEAPDRFLPTVQIGITLVGLLAGAFSGITLAEEIAAVLKPLPFAYEYRGMHPLALKIFDMAYYCEAPRFIMLDSDVLFFNHPREIMDWTGSGAKECWFNEDIAEGSLLSESDAQEDLGVKLWPRVNSGLALITKEAIDFEFCDRALGETPILKGHMWRVEQTLFALCASRYAKGGLLPKSYEVSLGKHSAEDCVARHYVGAVRHRFFAEGMKRLRPVLLAGESK